MAEETHPNVPAWPGLRDWLRIFSGATMALHPAKLGLALAGLILTFGWGWILDLAWTSTGQGVPPTELADFALVDTTLITETAAPVADESPGRGVGAVWRDHALLSVELALASALALSPSAFSASVGQICTATHWMVAKHPFYAVLLGLGALAIWSLFGAAICRIAAVQFAREDKIGPSEALRFARQKFASGFFMSPLLPLVILLIVALLMVIGALVLAIPGAGNAVSIIFGLAILGGLAMAFVVIGSVGGGSFFWPTVAVEGSDGFDAISRSFSYFFGRPVKTILYALTAVIWGAVCWVVLKFFLWLTLTITHACVSFGSFEKLDRLWPAPLFTDLYRFGDRAQMGGWEIVAAVLIGVWVLLAIGLLWAFLVSYYFSTSTIIYYLLRREVDATDYEDVYMEEPEEPATAPSPAAGPTPEQNDKGVSLPVVPPPAEAPPPAPPPPAPAAESSGPALQPPPPDSGSSQEPAPPQPPDEQPDQQR